MNTKILKLIKFIIFSTSIIYGTIIPGSNGPFAKNSISKKDYSGITLKILTHVKPNIGEPIEIHAREFEKLTGAKIIIKYVPWSQIVPEVVHGVRSGRYDIVTPCSDLIPDIAKFLAPVPLEILESEQWQDIMPYHKKIATYNNEVLQMSFDGDRHALHYRYDILEDPKIRKEYKKKFSKNLKVPKTWKELNSVAKFLNGRIINGKKIYGMVEITSKDDLLYSVFIKRASSYAKHPDVKGGFFFDLKTMKPLINTPGWVEALKDFVAIQKYYPPNGNNFGLVDVNASFGAGDAVFTDNWDDSFISAMEKTSPAYNNVLIELSPGSDIVWNRETKKWDTFNPPNQVPFISMGWISGVSVKSKQKDAAFDFLAYFSNPVNHRKDLLVGRFGVNPFRESDLDINFWINNAGWKPRVAKSFVNSHKKQMKAKARTFDLRIPGNSRYMYTLQVAVMRALKGLSTPQEALNYAAEKWVEITKRYGGIEKQRKFYSEIVKMEDAKSTSN